MKAFSLSSAEGVDGAWEATPYLSAADVLDERYGHWCSQVFGAQNRLPLVQLRLGFLSMLA